MNAQVLLLKSLPGLHPDASTPRLALSRSIKAGLPVAALDQLAATVAPDDAQFKFRLVPKATLERRRRTGQSLTADEGDRLARVAKVFDFALSLYHDAGKVRAFLNRPHMMLEGQTPLATALATGPGADEVINLLGRMAYGSAV